jgi:hypothetical protein
VSHKIIVAGTFFICFLFYLFSLSALCTDLFLRQKGKSLEQIETLFQSEVDRRSGRELQLSDVEKLVQEY